MKRRDRYISVDIETSGPVPDLYSMLSIGACVVGNPELSMYVELKPRGLFVDEESVSVTGLDLQELERNGLDPIVAMHKIDQWLAAVCEDGYKPIFVGLNAPFDWSFVNYYFHKYLKHNPFGFTALDIKACFMGALGCSWGEARSSNMVALLNPKTRPSHNALDDAVFQAELFELLLKGKSFKEGGA